MRIFQSFQNPVLSLWQSAINKVAKNHSYAYPNNLRLRHFNTLAHAFTHGNQFPSTDDLGNIIDECVKLVVELAAAEIMGDTNRVNELINELKMSTCDPGWVEVLDVYLQFKQDKGIIPYIRYNQLDDFVIQIPNKLTIGFIANWGTGVEDAKWLLQQVMASKPDILIHLGDIYYAGTLEEVQDNFLLIVKNVAGNIPVYTLSGNHDMYSGGKGYYWLLEQLKQPASYFCLRNDYWQFSAMDTGLNDCDPFSITSNVTYLDPGEVEWHLDKFKTAGNRKTILMSHHQLYSATGVGQNGQGQPIGFNPHLQGAFRDVLDQVSLWLWGHEHNMIVFNPYIQLKKGRCIGAGAIPMMVEQKPYTAIPDMNLQGQSEPPVMDLKKARLRTNRDGFYFHSYAIMSLYDDRAKIQYYEVDSIRNGRSRLLYSEPI